MFGKKAIKSQGRIDSLIGAGTSLTGDVTFSGGLRVDGEIRGNVRAADGQPATLVLSEHARIARKSKVHALTCLDCPVLYQADFDTLDTRLGGHLERAFQPPKVPKTHAILARGGIVGGGKLHHSSLLSSLHDRNHLNHAIEFFVFFLTSLTQ